MLKSDKSVEVIFYRKTSTYDDLRQSHQPVNTIAEYVAPWK